MTIDFETNLEKGILDPDHVLSCIDHYNRWQCRLWKKQIGFVGLFNQDIVVLLLTLPCHALYVAQSVQMGCLQSWV